MILIRSPRLLKLFVPIFGDGINALCLTYFLIYKDQVDDRLINHETIHWHQWKELWIFGFLFVYFYYHYKVGYWNNPLEREAYANERNLNYLKNRKRFAWKAYVSGKLK
jgi:hypothetical protein